MTPASLVSVIVPTRNSARTIAACLMSIRLQTYQPIQVIVVDNHSTDNTLQIANDNSDIVEVLGPERSAQRNRGARLAAGDYLLFIDSDMILSPEVVSQALDAIQRDSAPAVIIPEMSVGAGFLAHCRALERACYLGDDSLEAARFFRRPAFERTGGFDETLDAMEDWDLTTRVSLGKKLPRTLCMITHDEGNL